MLCGIPVVMCGILVVTQCGRLCGRQCGIYHSVVDYVYHSMVDYVKHSVVDNLALFQICGKFEKAYRNPRAAERIFIWGGGGQRQKRAL